MKVLVIEDALILRPIWIAFFKKILVPTELDWSISSEEALVKIENEIKNGTPHSLLIVDIFLSGSGTGIDLINSEIVKTNKIKSILTSSAMREQILQEYEHLLFGVEVISKPIDFGMVEPLVLRLLEKNANYEPE